MVFLLVRLKSESSWIFLCPSPKHQFLTEAFIDVQISCTFGGECLPAGSKKRCVGTLCLSAWSVRACQSKVGGFCSWGQGERWWLVVRGVFLTKSFSSLWLWASALPFVTTLDVNPALEIAGCAWTQFCEHWEAGPCSVSVPINWEMCRSTWDEINRSSPNSL